MNSWLMAFGPVPACSLSLVFAHDFADGLVVGIDLPDSNLSIFDHGSPCCRCFPEIFFLDLSVFGECSVGHAEHGNGIAAGEYLVVGNCIVGNHLEVSLPSGAQARKSFHTTTQGVS